MPHLSLFLFGAPRIEVDAAPVKVETRKAIALLAYLAVTSQTHKRDALVALLWPEYGQRRGRTILRHILYSLRRSLGGGWLDSSREDVGLRHSADIRLDVAELKGCLAECREHGHAEADVCQQCIDPLSRAAVLYRGDFLEGFSLKDSANFDDWQFFQTEQLQREAASVLERLVKRLSDMGRFEPAIDHALRWLALDSMHETAHCWLMKLYAWAGKRSAALRQYRE